MAEKSDKSEQAKRLAEQLRANLRRRKSQAREQGDEPAKNKNPKP